MKNSFLILFFALTSSFSFAQNKGYISLSLGASIPTGDFASKDVNNSSAGFAKTGGVLDLSFGYKLTKNYGIAAMVRGQRNNMDDQPIADEISKVLPSDFNRTIECGSWRIGGIMVGGYGSFPVSKKISFEPRVMFGFLSAKSPDLTINMSNAEETVWVKQSSVSTSAFAHMLGASFHYDAGKRVGIFLNFDYLGAKPEFRNVEMTTSDGTRETGTYSQTFGTINMGLGIGYRL